MYNAFPTTYLARLQSHHSELQEVKKVTRGRQFHSYSQGSMIPKGARAPVGGAPGDSYTFYAGMEAITANGINALFNDAEVSPQMFIIYFMRSILHFKDSMVLLETSRILAFPIFQDLQETTSRAEKLGTSGSTVYLCNNYTSPLHRDNDSAHGLCAQYELLALIEFLEYSFIYADYGLYMVSHYNSLW